MKVLLKLFSEANKIYNWNTETARAKLFQLLSHAESKDIVIWHVGKNIPFEEGYVEYISNSLTLIGGSFRSIVSLDKTYDYFKYQYFTDTIEGRKHKSEVTNRKGIFKEVDAFFEDGVSIDLIELFEGQQGKIVKTKKENPVLIVKKVGEKLISNDPSGYPFFTINQDMFRSLFPEINNQKSETEKKNIKELRDAYSAEEIEESLVSNRSNFNVLKKLLVSGDKDMIDSGLLLLSSLNDPYVADLLLCDISFSKSNVSILEVNGAFKGSSKVQPFHNYAITGILYNAPKNAVYCNSLKSSIIRLSIDIIDLSGINAFHKLEYLELYDSCGYIKSLENLSSKLPINVVRLENCSALNDISRISDFAISTFTFVNCPKITGFKALEGKTDRGGVKKISFDEMNDLESLDGIEFYQELEDVNLSNCDKLVNATALLKCPKLREVISNWLPSCTSIDGLIGKEQTSLELIFKNWSSPVHGSFKIESINFNCSGMSNLEWLKLFPNTTSLKINCYELSDISGLRFVPKLRDLRFISSKIDSIESISGLQALQDFSLKYCNNISNLSALLDLQNLHSITISNCESFEDYSCFFSIKSIHFDSVYQFSYLPKLIRLGDLSHITQLREFKFLYSFNQSILNDISTAPNLLIINIDQKEVQIGTTHKIPIPIRITGAESLDLNNAGVENLKLENCDIKNISGLKSLKVLKHLSITGCSLFESLSGKEHFPKLESLELVELQNLKSLHGLEQFPNLRRIKLHGLTSISDVSLLACLRELIEVDCFDCPNFEVPSKPIGKLTNTQTTNFIIKVATHYNLKYLNDWQAKAEKISIKKSSITTKMKLGIKKLLLSRDISNIKTGVSLIIGANDAQFYEELLQGTGYDGESLLPNKLFSGTGPAQPFLNTALMGVLSGASLLIDHWKDFCKKITDLKIELISIDYLNCLHRIKNIKLKNLTNFTIILNLPDLETFYLKEPSHEFRSVDVQMKLSQFENCIKLRILNVESSVYIDDFRGFNNLTCLEQFIFTSIKGIDIPDLIFLSNCTKLRYLKLSNKKYSFNNQYNSIRSLNGIEEFNYLLSLTIVGADLENTSALKSMISLQKIIITGCKSLFEFTPPENAVQLDTIEISNCPNLVKVVPAKYPISLYVTFEDIGLISFPELSGTKFFKDITLKFCKSLKDIDGLKNVSKLGDDNYINFEGCDSLKNLNGISHLKGLNIRISTSKLPMIVIPNGITILKSCTLHTLENIELYQSIEKLDISSSAVKHLTPLAKLNKLKFLNLSNIKSLKSLAGLENLTSLENLSLIDLINLDDVSAIEHLNLKFLYIKGCKKKKVDFPSHLQPVINWQSSSFYW